MTNRRLRKNKVMGIGLIIFSIVGTLVMKEATAFLFFLILGVGLLFAKQNWIS